MIFSEFKTFRATFPNPDNAGESLQDEFDRLDSDGNGIMDDAQTVPDTSNVQSATDKHDAAAAALITAEANLAKLARVEEWGQCSSAESTHIAVSVKGAFLGAKAQTAVFDPYDIAEMTLTSVNFTDFQALTVTAIDRATDTFTFDSAVTNVDGYTTAATLRRPCDQFGALVQARSAAEDAERKVRMAQKAHDNLVTDLMEAVAVEVAFPQLAMVPIPNVFLSYEECNVYDGVNDDNHTTTTTTTSISSTTTTVSSTTTTVSSTTTSETSTTTSVSTTTTTTPIPIVDNSLTTGEIGGIAAGTVFFLVLLLIVWMIHSRTGHLPRKNDPRLSWVDPNANRLKKYGSEDDLKPQTHASLRDEARLSNHDKHGRLSDPSSPTSSTFPAAASLPAAQGAGAGANKAGYSKGAVYDRNASGHLAGMAEPVLRFNSATGSQVRPSMTSVGFPEGQGGTRSSSGGAGASDLAASSGYIKMAAQSGPEPTYAYKDSTVNSMDIPEPIRLSAGLATRIADLSVDAGVGDYVVGIGDFLQPEMEGDAPGMYGVGTVAAEVGADMPGQYGVGTVAPSRSSNASIGSARMSGSRSGSAQARGSMGMATGEALMQQVMQRMNTLERENNNLRRSVKASMKLSMAAARSSSAGQGARTSIDQAAVSALRPGSAPQPDLANGAPVQVQAMQMAFKEQTGSNLAPEGADLGIAPQPPQAPQRLPSHLGVESGEPENAPASPTKKSFKTQVNSLPPPPPSPAGTVVFNDTATLPRDASLSAPNAEGAAAVEGKEEPKEEETYASVKKQQAPMLKPKKASMKTSISPSASRQSSASASGGSRSGSRAGSAVSAVDMAGMVQAEGGDTSAEAAVQLPGTMDSGGAMSAASRESSSESIMDVEQLTLNTAREGSAASRGSRSGSVKVGTRRSSAVQQARASASAKSRSIARLSSAASTRRSSAVQQARASASAKSRSEAPEDVQFTSKGTTFL